MKMRQKALFFALVFASGAVFAKATSEITDVPLKPNASQNQAAVLAARFLTRFHYKATPLDAKMSTQVFDRYLDALDPDRLFFVQSDIDRFTPMRDKLGNAIYDEDLSVPFAIFNLYEQRVNERTAYARDELKKGFDFTKDESYQYQREKTPWAKTEVDVNDIWRKRVKNDWLRLKLAGKEDAKIRETLDKRYGNYLDRLHQLNGEDVFQTFMNAYAMAIEPHTNYLGPRARDNFDIQMKLSLEGIGAVLQRDDDYTAIREIVPGGPAALSGKIQVGDRIVGVGQGNAGPLTDVIGWRLDDVVEKIRGAKDTTVRLEVLPADVGPDGKHQMIAIVRKKVSIEEQAAKSSVIETKDGEVTRHIGVISLPTFYEDFEAHSRGDKDYRSATRDVSRLLTELKGKKVDGVLIDLRNNGGGSLSEAIDLTGLFVDGGGPAVQVRGSDGRIEEGNTHPSVAWNGPLAVLVNRNSASASEIFAAAIQDYGRGLILGEPTFGKGTVQKLVDLDQIAHNEKPTFGELKMTTAQFFRINGGSTQLRGVTPDISFPVTGDFDQNGEQAFDNALPWTSIAAADYSNSGNIKDVVPPLIARHDARVAIDREWQAYQADVSDSRKLRKENSISLNEQVRRAERDEQNAKRKERHPDLVASNSPTAKESESARVGANAGQPASGDQTNIRRVDVESANPVITLDKPTTAESNAKSPPKRNADNSRQDDGLQADERSLKAELAQEKAAKSEKDVVLHEASHILADEVDLLRKDTQLAARVLPQDAVKDAVN
jgi:carboxyl-terminal processing protease